MEAMGPLMAIGRSAKLSSVVLLVVFLVTGCARQVWIKPGATQSEFQVAKGRCIAAAYSQVPAAPAVATIGGGYVSPTYTTCSGYGYSATCFTSGGQYTPPARIPYDANAAGRNEVFNGCMYADGWSLEKQ
jgi:hypothetical protein